MNTIMIKVAIISMKMVTSLTNITVGTAAIMPI